MRFHSAHKLVLMAHSPDAYRQLGRFVARARLLSREEVEQCYSRDFAAALAVAPTRGRHVNVLQHIAGYFTDRLDAASRAGLQSAIDGYRDGTVPLDVPIALLRQYAGVHRMTYLEEQVHLQEVSSAND